MPAAVAAAGGEDAALDQLRRVLDDPSSHAGDEHFGDVARLLTQARERARAAFAERAEPAPFQSWCADAEEGALAQMRSALRLPSAVHGALMPDAHLGYGLPIGGVLATEGTVIPYGVGVDIACRMKLTVLDLPAGTLDDDPGRLERALLRETQFGTGASLPRP